MELQDWQFWVLFFTPIVTIGAAVWKMSSWITSINLRLKFLEEAAKEFRVDIKKLFTGISPSPIASQSPVQLTEYGEKISRTVNVKQWAKREASNLIEEVRGKEEFEIYDLCIHYVSKQFTETPEFTKIVKSGAYQLGTDPETVLKVFNVVLRDAVIELSKSYSDNNTK